MQRIYDENDSIEDKILILVCGMHRSGTSLVTKSLEVLGVELGDNLLPPADDNPKGFFEDIEINQLNIKMLDEIGIAWHSLSMPSQEEIKQLITKGYNKTAKEILYSKLVNTKIFGLKDPRIVQLLEFWNIVFDELNIKVNYIIVVRNPLSVAKSLQKRDAFDYEKSLLLWMGYTLFCIDHTQGKKRIFIEYDRMIKSPDVEIKRISKAFGFKINKERLQKFIQEFIEEDLRHNIYTIEDIKLDKICPAIVKEIYLTLQNNIENQKDNIRGDIITKWMHEYNRVKNILCFIDKLYDRQLFLAHETANKKYLRCLIKKDAKIYELEIKLDKAIAQREEKERIILELIEQNISKNNITNRQLKTNIKYLNSDITKRLISAAKRYYDIYGLARRVYHVIPTKIKYRVKDQVKNLLTAPEQDEYLEWINRNEKLNEKEMEIIIKRISEFKNPPLISVLMPTYNTDEEYLRKAIESVCNQIYPYWELCIADDASTKPHVFKVLKEYASRDPRIKIVLRETNGHISAASNSALEIATGDYVGLLDHDDEISNTALYLVAEEVLAHPDVELIYSDEDKIDEDGIRREPYFKPDWNPELLLCQNCISHFGIYKRSRLIEIGGFRIGYEGAQDWDVALRFIEKIDKSRIRHIPAVLYHWRVHKESTASNIDVKPYTRKSQKKCIEEHLERTGQKARLEAVCNNVFWIPHFMVDDEPKVTLIIVDEKQKCDLYDCLNSLKDTAYTNYNTSILIEEKSEQTYDLNKINGVNIDKIIKFKNKDDLVKKINDTIKKSQSKYICILTCGVKILTPKWLEEMVGIANRDGVGAVGAKLLNPDNTINHAGLILGVNGIAGNAHKNYHYQSPGYFGRAKLVQSFSAVTGDCLLFAKKIWENVGGIDPRFQYAYWDIDFCLKIQEHGFRNIWTPAALLVIDNNHDKYKHSEEKKEYLEELRFAMQKRWGHVLFCDPAYNPNLTLESEDFAIAKIPRIKFPWHEHGKNNLRLTN